MFGFNKKGKCITRAFKTANVQPTPCIFGDNKIIYCTRYEPENELSTGIFQYNTLTNYHTTIALWKDIKYYPRWNTTIVSSKRNIFISAAGVNVKNGNENYALLLIFNLKTKQHSKINIGMQLGKNPKLLFSNNDNHLHIIGGTESGKHMLFDLTNNQMSQIYDFNQMNPGISSQMLLYSKTKNVIIMFGGLHHNGETLFDDFWTCEMHNYKWTKKDQFKLPKRREAAGAVLYRDRVIIMFGGRTPKRESESLYYLDLKGINGWNKSKITLPKGGRYNAILMKNDKIHVLPYYSHEHHYEINVTDILPHLLLKDVNEETKLNDEYDEKKDVFDNEDILSHVFNDLNAALDVFRKKYSEHKLQEMMQKSPKEIIGTESVTNKSIKNYKDKIQQIYASAGTFVKCVNEVESCIQKLSVPNVKEYEIWNLNQIMMWILSLDGGKFSKYEGKLRNGFVKSQILVGSVLPELNRNDLSSSPFDIDEFIVKKQLVEHFQSLRKKMNDDNIAEGIVTEYH
eukprot:367568_1